MTATPVLQVREWSTTTPQTPFTGQLLRGLELNDADRKLLEELANRNHIQVTELRGGLSISVGPHIGTVQLSNLRLVILPKLRIEQLMRMVAYAFELSDLLVTDAQSPLEAQNQGLIDLLGLALLRAVERIARGGLLPAYENRNEDLSTPRGRLDLRYIATHPRRATLRCTYDDLSVDHALNHALNEGLRLAARVMDSADLRLDLARSADRFFGDLRRVSLDSGALQSLLKNLDRRSNHYRTALTLISLIQHGARVSDHAKVGAVPLSSFTLNMNMLFERFLGRYLRENAPPSMHILTQDSRTDVFGFLSNPHGWRRPMIRPDFVFRSGERTVAIGDAKYKNRHEHPPSTSELYQLTTYGLAYDMPEPREVLLLHPTVAGDEAGPTTLLFGPSSLGSQVRIRLVGVPLDAILDGTLTHWWPLPSAAPSFRSAAL